MTDNELISVFVVSLSVAFFIVVPFEDELDA